MKTKKLRVKERKKLGRGLADIGIKVNRTKKGLEVETTGFDTDGAQLIVEAVSNIICQTDASAAEIEERLAQVCSTIQSLEPRDGFEGLLVSQMVIAYGEAMECFRLAKISTNKKELIIYKELLIQGSKLMRLYTQQILAIDGHRQAVRDRVTPVSVNCIN